MSDNINGMHRAALVVLAAPVVPGGYSVDAKVLSELQEKGLVHLKVDLTDAGRKVLDGPA